MADLNLSQVTGGLKIVSEVSSQVLNQYSTKRNNLAIDEITIISGLKYNYAEFNIKFSDYENVYFDGDVVADAEALETILEALTQKLDVALQDQTTKPIIAKFNRVTNSTTLASDASQEDTSIVLTSGTGFINGAYVIIFNATSVRFMFATVVDNSGSPTIVIDTPLDSDFPAGTFVDAATTDLSTAIGTLASPISFGLRGTGAPPGVDLSVDITRIIFTATCTSTVDLTTFINLAKLTNGLVLRKRNGETDNIFNVKDNKEIAALMYDVQVQQAINPQQGVDGLLGRLTFAGQSKIGVVIRLPIGEDLEFLVQDDLETAQGGETITRLEITAEGHIVD